jgi:hypothetical protein
LPPAKQTNPPLPTGSRKAMAAPAKNQQAHKCAILRFNAIYTLLANTHYQTI